MTKKKVRIKILLFFQKFLPQNNSSGEKFLYQDSVHSTICLALSPSQFLFTFLEIMLNDCIISDSSKSNE